MRTETINDILSVCKLYRGALPSDADFHFQTPYCCVTNVDSHNGKELIGTRGLLQIRYTSLIALVEDLQMILSPTVIENL